MRPLRFLLSLATCAVAFILLLYIGPWVATTEDKFAERSTSINTYFNWRTPSSLFPPSAIISLVDDNSTFFLARPAAFGPALPGKSLSGQLWIGSGFGDDDLRGGTGGRADGELGCSDIPDWDSGSYRTNAGTSIKSKSDAGSSKSDVPLGKGSKVKRGSSTDQADKDGLPKTVEIEHAEDDGTDDHLHHPLLPSDGMKTNGASAGNGKKPVHADIQSLQEGAEIAGKIVLLSRGGCGFLEKVKWTQRRGGVGLVVGDDIRGGPLVTMYAHGDTSNVTIPAVFTSHMTAHLLASLIPSGGGLDDIAANDAARLGLVFGDKPGLTKAVGSKKDADKKPNFTSTTAAVRSAPTNKAATQDKESKSGANAGDETAAETDDEVGWFMSLFRGRSLDKDSRRPPSSGNIGWVQEDFDNKKEGHGKTGKHAVSSTTKVAAAAKTSNSDSSDGFVIGVQDWRDPDMVADHKERVTALTASASSSSIASSTRSPKSTGLRGGSVMPGSGEYGKQVHEAVDLLSPTKQSPKNPTSPSRAEIGDDRPSNWFSRLFAYHEKLSGDEKPGKKTKTKSKDSKAVSEPIRLPSQSLQGGITQSDENREGLWITLTPTAMSSSPFFDTLLVLVVSPLVTLTIVYALLLLRSRIRRRRWRAPKSVVERLPVRTYQTMPNTTPDASSTTSSVASLPTATTPLLPSQARPINARPRPRASTEGEALGQAGLSLRSDSMASPSLDVVEERRAAGLAEWRKRYGGKQRECVVCLEEYVDGVSRVMSLPCGHEFHAECITPWLTTRRRTCPICKGDVVRSMARNNATAANAGTPSTSPHVPPPELPVFHAEEDDVQEQAAMARNDDPSAARPVSREDEAFEDLERGVAGRVVPR